MASGAENARRRVISLGRSSRIMPGPEKLGGKARTNNPEKGRKTHSHEQRAEAEQHSRRVSSCIARIRTSRGAVNLSIYIRKGEGGGIPRQNGNTQQLSQIDHG